MPGTDKNNRRIKLESSAGSGGAGGKPFDGQLAAWKKRLGM
jgi:hypothetical protein